MITCPPLSSPLACVLTLLHRLKAGELEGDQGYWSACYGPHGMEIVHVAMCGPSEPGAARCPNGTSQRLVATKVSDLIPPHPCLHPMSITTT